MSNVSGPVCEDAYLPACLPRPPHRVISYTINVFNAPKSALSGVSIDCRIPRTPVSRSRKAVRNYALGSTNRWRLPQELGGDLLGSSQALKAVSSARKNESLTRVQTADSSQLSMSRLQDEGWHRSSPLGRPFSVYSAESRGSPQHGRKKQLDFVANSACLSQFDTPTYSKSKYLSSAQLSQNRFRDPLKLLEMFAHLANQKAEPDVRLHFADQVWPLHSAYLVKSTVLRKLLSDDKSYRVYNDESAQKLDSYISQADNYSPEYKEVTKRLTSQEVERVRVLTKSKGTLTRPLIELTLSLCDDWVTKHALAIGLGHLYLEEAVMSSGDVIETLAVACNLQFDSLMIACCSVMMDNIAPETVCLYMEAAQRYNQTAVTAACERWLELNLVPQLSNTVYLRDVPESILEKVLKSSRLFTYNEYSLYKTLCYWLFMRLHSDMHFMPSQTTVMTYFSSLTRTCSFLERECGVMYSNVFSCLRLHGITEIKHLQDVMYMNILPQTWLLRVFSHHYHALQGGGDMSFLLNFSAGASRYGFILDEDPGYHSEIYSLHGFHFEAKAQRHGAGNTYIAYIQRLRPTDPSLTFRACERATFSMRRDRLARYQICVQHPTTATDTRYRHVSTGVLEQKFGLDHRTARSQVLRIEDVKPPIYVSFSVFFPPS